MGKHKKNKKDKDEKSKKKLPPRLRTKEERSEQVKTIIEKLSQFELSLKYKPIQELYALFKIYINEGSKTKISIPFPMINRRIKGELTLGTREDCWVKLENEKF